jgi:flagellin
MGVGLINNAAVLTAQHYAKLAQLQRTNSLTKLATGSRLNRASDGPADLIASENLRATLAALDAETRANERASVMADVADGALGQVSDLLVEAKALVAANANTSGLSDAEKDANQLQLDSIVATVSAISKTTSFLGSKLLDGTGKISASGQSQAIASTLSSDLGKIEDGGADYALADLTSGKSLDTSAGSSEIAGKVIDAAIKSVSTTRAQIGAFQSHQLQTRIRDIDGEKESMMSALSLIKDTDFSMEVAQSIRSQLLEKTSLAVMKIARYDREHILNLLS